MEKEHLVYKKEDNAPESCQGGDFQKVAQTVGGGLHKNVGQTLNSHTGLSMSKSIPQKRADRFPGKRKEYTYYVHFKKKEDGYHYVEKKM